MHPRKLGRNDCSGGSCPAVFGSDDLPGQLLVRGRNADALPDRPPGHAPDESDVIISRALVADALRPADEAVTPAGFEAQFETFSFSAFRLETLQHYAGTTRDDQWVALLRRSRRWGKTHQRVHVITEPLTAAMQQELTEGYGPNVAAGEDIGIISCPDGDVWPDGVPRYDFWLFDGTLLYEMDYHPDGSWAGARRVRDPERILDACHAREAALFRAVSWRTYIASRPDLQRRLAQ